jgi:wobble nucleotide-excising tRNase
VERSLASKINERSKFFTGLTELALDESIAGYLSRYADFDFDIDYKKWEVTFRKGADERIKISRGEEKVFILCMFMAICERVIDGHSSYQWVKHLYIDDPISSLDDNNAVAIACDLAALVRRAATRRSASGERNPLRTVFSSHHALFFNVMCNELGRTKQDQEKVTIKRFFLHRPDSEGVFTLRATADTPYFHHVAVLAELRKCSQEGTLYTFHFNALRSVLEKTASFLGHDDLKVCLAGLEDEALYNRALNLLSHGKYAIHEPVEMGEDNKELFRRIFNDVLRRFQFALPELLPEITPQKDHP